MTKSSLPWAKTGRKHAIILGIPIDSTPKDLLLKEIEAKVKNKEQFYIVTPNPEIILHAQSDRDLASIINKADYSLPDGVGVVWAAGRSGQMPLKQFSGRQAMTAFFTLAGKNHFKVFLFGATPEVIGNSLRKLTREFPGISADGFSGPKLNRDGDPDTLVDRQLQMDTVARINRFKPDFVFVALGCPKQEKWIEKNRHSLEAKCLMTVGGALDYYSGVKKLPPRWMENAGLEWLWRLITEPARACRILNATVVFPLKVILSK